MHQYFKSKHYQVKTLSLNLTVIEFVNELYSL